MISIHSITGRNLSARKTPDILSPRDSVVIIETDDSSFSIKCSKHSVAITGNLELSSHGDLMDYAKLISDAWKLKTSLSR